MSHKILIIEDERMLVEMYSDRFRQEGFEVHYALDAEDGFKKVQDVKPDIILLDILLPRENGVDFLEKATGLNLLEETPVIAFSNYDDKDTKKRSLELGVKEYLIKADYTPREILEIVKKYLN